MLSLDVSSFYDSSSYDFTINSETAFIGVLFMTIVTSAGLYAYFC